MEVCPVLTIASFYHAIGALIVISAVAAANADTQNMATALIILASFFIGWNESVCLSLSGIELLDQREIGTAVGGMSYPHTLPPLSQPA